MTKAELEKEATAYALEWGNKTDGTYACCREAYIAGAEPREKRIAKLEEINADLKQSLDWADKREHDDYVTMRELRKENAELKEKLSEQKLYTEFKCNEAVKKREVYEKEHRLFTKAKELLNEFMRISKASVEDFEHDYSELIVEAEQLIKE